MQNQSMRQINARSATIRPFVLRRTVLPAALAAMGVALGGCFGWMNDSRNNAAGSGGGAPISIDDTRTKEQEAAASTRRARILKDQGLIDQALREFDKAIENNPKLTVAYIGAGDIHRERGDYASAEVRYGQAAAVEPRNFDAQYLHGLMLQLLNRLGESVQAYTRAIAIRPNDFDANLNLATAFLQLDDPAQGLPYGQAAVRINGDSAAARTNLGAIYTALGRFEDAVVEYQQAAELAPLSAPLLLNLADALGKSGRNEEMVNTLQELTRTEPSADAFERLGTGQFRLRKYAEAEAAFRKAIEIDPNHYPALNGIGVCLLNKYVWSDQRDETARSEALQVLRRSVQIERGQPGIIDLISRYD